MMDYFFFFFFYLGLTIKNYLHFCAFAKEERSSLAASSDVCVWQARSQAWANPGSARVAQETARVAREWPKIIFL